jgi:hypothetical protein
MPTTSAQGNVPSATSSTIGTAISGGAGPSASPSNGQPQQNGLSPLPGPTTSDTNPSNPIEGQSTAASAGAPVLGTFQDALAFNNPSFIPADRPPIPFTQSPGAHLPFDIYQTANTPFGIRNFEIGPNTSMAHGGSPVLPPGSRLSRPTMTSVDELGLPMFAQMSAIERHLLKADDGTSADDLALASIEDVEVAQSPLANPSTVNETAIDRMMSDEASIDQMLGEDFLGDDALTDKIAADKASAAQTRQLTLAPATLQQVEANRPDDRASPVALAATVTVAMGVPTQWTERRNRPDSDSWRKDARFRPRRP